LFELHRNDAVPASAPAAAPTPILRLKLSKIQKCIYFEVAPVPAGVPEKQNNVALAPQHSIT
jgi:hypothetical protein